jgi:hypothetical protein
MSKGRVLTKKKWGHCARYWRKYKYRIKFPRGKLNSFEETHAPIVSSQVLIMDDGVGITKKKKEKS